MESPVVAVKDNKLLKGAFTVGGIMVTLVIYGVLQKEVICYFSTRFCSTLLPASSGFVLPPKASVLATPEVVVSAIPLSVHTPITYVPVVHVGDIPQVSASTISKSVYTSAKPIFVCTPSSSAHVVTSTVTPDSGCCYYTLAEFGRTFTEISVTKHDILSLAPASSPFFFSHSSPLAMAGGRSVPVCSSGSSSNSRGGLYTTTICSCGLDAVVRTVKKGHNIGSRFYGCPKWTIEDNAKTTGKNGGGAATERRGM
uniref:Zinc finger GRF-type domain-containing protein n=1 Tax=Chenopodium quinoa TaxID=63459 RepID=A0A803MVJ4_CHEQI